METNWLCCLKGLLFSEIIFLMPCIHFCVVFLSSNRCGKKSVQYHREARGAVLSHHLKLQFSCLPFSNFTRVVCGGESGCITSGRSLQLQISRQRQYQPFSTKVKISVYWSTNVDNIHQDCEKKLKRCHIG